MKRFCMIIFTFILLLLFAACMQNTPDNTDPTLPPTEPAEPTDPTEATAPAEAPTLSQSDLTAIEDYLNDPVNNRFISYNYYDSVEKIDLLQVFYDGAGISIPLAQWESGEAEAVLAAMGWEEFFNSPIKIPAAAANAYLLEKCGLPLSAFNNGTIPDFHYVESYDAYYTMHGDTNRISVTVLNGEIDSTTGHYIIRYHSGTEAQTFTVFLDKTETGYLFISNIQNEETDDPYAVHEIDADRITIDGSIKTYKDETLTLSVPADWRALEQHGEDGTSYFFSEPAFDNCQLKIYHTGAEYVLERTEAEYLALFNRQGLEDIKILSFTKEKLSGYDCTKVVYSYSSAGTEYIAVRYDNIVKGFALLEFSTVYPAAEHERFAPVFESIIDSIKL